MAVDTKTKRLSMIGFGMPFRITLPEPDGDLDVGDRLHLMGLYAGTVEVETPQETVDGWVLKGKGRTWTLRDRVRTWILKGHKEQ